MKERQAFPRSSKAEKAHLQQLVLNLRRESQWLREVVMHQRRRIRDLEAAARERGAQPEDDGAQAAAALKAVAWDARSHALVGSGVPSGKALHRLRTMVGRYVLRGRPRENLALEDMGLDAANAALEELRQLVLGGMERDGRGGTHAAIDGEAAVAHLSELLGVDGALLAVDDEEADGEEAGAADDPEPADDGSGSAAPAPPADKVPREAPSLGQRIDELERAVEDAQQREQREQRPRRAQRAPRAPRAGKDAPAAERTHEPPRGGGAGDAFEAFRRGAGRHLSERLDEARARCRDAKQALRDAGGRVNGAKRRIDEIAGRTREPQAGAEELREAKREYREHFAAYTAAKERVLELQGKKDAALAELVLAFQGQQQDGRAPAAPAEAPAIAAGAAARAVRASRQQA